MTEEQLQEMLSRCLRGEPLRPEESLKLALRVRKLEYDLSGMDEMYNTLCMQTQTRREEQRALARRLGYVLNLLGREARFKSRQRPEDTRFFRGYDTLEEIVGQLG
jgi:hypothetical protein